jgi:hypothetical protein
MFDALQQIAMLTHSGNGPTPPSAMGLDVVLLGNSLDFACSQMTRCTRFFAIQQYRLMPLPLSKKVNDYRLLIHCHTPMAYNIVKGSTTSPKNHS